MRGERLNPLRGEYHAIAKVSVSVLKDILANIFLIVELK